MKSIISFTVLSAIAGALAQVTMNTPSNLVVCQPVQLTWSGGLAPYFISVQDGNNPSGPALQRFDNENGTSLTWLVNLQAGTSVGFLLRDSNGATSQTASVTVQAGSALASQRLSPVAEQTPAELAMANPPIPLQPLLVLALVAPTQPQLATPALATRTQPLQTPKSVPQVSLALLSSLSSHRRKIYFGLDIVLYLAITIP
ncbi:hypothetical protein L218DRAFT_644904 [Marasmius fiardii PR-910]|nr:hypothetical protein L218DRAFT_644904 [Marasmius fiardii PR-910]